MSEDERPSGDDGQEELIAGFAALGGPLTGDELIRLLGSDEYYGAVVRLATLLLDGDAAAAEDVARDSLAALQRVWNRLGDRGTARVYLYRTVMDRSRSMRRYRAIEGHDTARAAPGAPGPGPAAGSLGPEPSVWALRGLPHRQREAVVLRTYLGLSEKQAAEAMGISRGAVRSHLARGLSSLPRPPGPP
jgi:DNA-directed RNA polymerase specialized sigma24 family protein